MSKHQHHLTFFRQSGWMMVATTLSGIMMSLVHKPASQMPKEQYGLFGTLLNAIGLMAIPAVGLQGIFAQQAAASLNPEHERELAGVLRGVLRGTFVLWLMMAGIVFLLRSEIYRWYKITDPAALGIMVLTGLIFLWRPVVLGVLQGRQNFLWCGWSGIIEGVVRFGGVFVVVGLLGGHAAGALAAVLAGACATLLVGGWFSRDCFVGDAPAMNWRAWLARVAPLTLGLGVSTFMLTADTVFFVPVFFPKDQFPYYLAAGTIGRAVYYFSAPLTAVMYPKVARGAALGEETSALKLTLGLTALAGGSGALMCTIFPSLPLQILTNESFVRMSSPLVPWFAWCMLPLTLSTVLINSLMARSRFAAVPWLLAVALGYGTTLYFLHDTFKSVILTIGTFGLILLAVCSWFSFFQPSRKNTAAPG